MKILYVHERFGALGGAEANVLITASELRRRGSAVGIWHGPDTGKQTAEWTGAFENRWRMDGAPRELLERIQTQFNPDLAFVHKTADTELIATLVESGIPLVRMVHDHDIYCMRSYKYGYFSRKICTRPIGWHCVFPCLASVVKNPGPGLPLKYVSYREKKREIRLNQRFDRMIVVTEYMRDELLRNGFEAGRIRILPPIPRNTDGTVRSSFSARNLIVYAGQLIRGKGVDVLLDALSLVHQPFECLILGDGNQRLALEKRAGELGLHGRVRFRGFLPQDELKSFFAECSLVAISSVWPEPIATIGLEVMRYGLPVVAFNAGGIKDWLKHGENGFLVPWMDRRQYAARLDQLLSDKALARQMGECGRRMAGEKYDFETYIRSLELLFGEVIAESGGGRILAGQARVLH